MALVNSIAKIKKTHQAWKLKATGVDAHVKDTATGAIFAGEADRIAMQVVAESGNHTEHGVVLQGSIDGTNFVNTTTTVDGCTGAVLTTPTYPYYRAAICTIQASASVVSILLFAHPIS